MSKTVDELILELESLYLCGYVPGTTISRVLAPESGVRFCVGAGLLERPKRFYYADTVQEALVLAISGEISPKKD